MRKFPALNSEPTRIIDFPNSCKHLTELRSLRIIFLLFLRINLLFIYPSLHFIAYNGKITTAGFAVFGSFVYHYRLEKRSNFNFLPRMIAFVAFIMILTLENIRQMPTSSRQSGILFSCSMVKYLLYVVNSCWVCLGKGYSSNLSVYSPVWRTEKAE